MLPRVAKLRQGNCNTDTSQHYLGIVDANLIRITSSLADRLVSAFVDPSGYWGVWYKNKFPETPVDITMSTLTHFDHDAIDRPISTHYLSETTTFTLSTLQPADEWVKGQKSFTMLDSASLSLASAEVAQMDREFMYFGHNAQTA